MENFSAAHPVPPAWEPTPSRIWSEDCHPIADSPTSTSSEDIPSTPPPTSARSSQRRKGQKPPGHISRPPNAFILFRSAFWEREKSKAEPVERDHRDISRIAGICWRGLDPSERNIWKSRAQELRESHQRQFPDYRVSPAPRRPRAAKCKSKALLAKEERCRRLASAIMENDVKFLPPKGSSHPQVCGGEKPALQDVLGDDYGHCDPRLDVVDYSHLALQQHVFSLKQTTAAFRHPPMSVAPSCSTPLVADHPQPLEYHGLQSTLHVFEAYDHLGTHLPGPVVDAQVMELPIPGHHIWSMDYSESLSFEQGFPHLSHNQGWSTFVPAVSPAVVSNIAPAVQDSPLYD